MSRHSSRAGRLRQVQAGLQVAEGRPGVRGSAAAPEGVPGIVRGQGQQPGPVAPRGHQQAHFGALFVAEQGLQEPAIRDLSGQQQFIGQRPALGVILFEKGPQQIAVDRQFRDKNIPGCR